QAHDAPHGAWRSLLARGVWDAQVASSNPAAPMTPRPAWRLSWCHSLCTAVLFGTDLFAIADYAEGMYEGRAVHADGSREDPVASNHAVRQLGAADLAAMHGLLS